MDEIIMGIGKRANSVFASTDKAEVMYMTRQDFFERIMQAHPETKRNLIKQLQVR